MIRYIEIPGSGKHNWIDQNSVVFGYSDYQQCCEDWGWGVFDPSKKERIAEDPDGMPYHFVFEDGAKEGEAAFSDVDYPDVVDVVHVTLAHDEDESKRLVFECFCNHNGYYYHDFSFEKREPKKEPSNG